MDGYIFPCVRCGDGAVQVSATVDSISGYGMLWYDVERLSWSSDKASNQAFIKSMVDEGIARGVHAGIYTSYYNWQDIVGLDWSYPASQGL